MTCGTKGGLVSGKKQSMKSVSNNEWREVSRGHSKPMVANIGEGLNFRRYKLMNVTESRFKNRQLHMEDYLQMVSAEQKEYAEVFDYSKITEKSGVITDYWTNNLLDLILRKENLNGAYKQVKRNKGKGGIDGMQVDELLPFLRENQETLIQEIREGKYKPNPVRRVEIPKETKGELFIAEDTEKIVFHRSEEVINFWRENCIGDVTVIMIPGNHLTCFTDVNNIQKLVNKITEK